MPPPPHLPLLALALLPPTSSDVLSDGIDRAERLQLREEVREMFYHGYESYLANAFPKDELLPLSCTGKDHPDGGWGALTAVDALDTLLVMGNHTEFERIARWATEHVTFDMNKTVSLFETNIRILGGLLSAHQMALDPDRPCFQDPARPYDHGLLRLAHDLGERLLPAFETPTGIPYGSVNLRFGVDERESNVTAAATAGTLIVEFWTLSQLTGDDRFSRAAKAAVRGLWRQRSALNLVGAHINVQTGEWTQKDSGIGGLIDSFYEYLLKGALLTQDPEYLHMFNQAYTAVTNSLKLGAWYVEVNMDSGLVVWPTFSSLQCFWPGMQALIGDLDAAAETMEAFYRMWNVYGAVPEGFNLLKEGVSLPGYPLRPELAESAMYMHEATDDPIYLDIGKQIVASLQTITRVECGFASIENVVTKELADIMDSFFLAETCKYLYLLFDSDHWIRRGRYIFNTEGHPFALRPGRPNMTAARVEDWVATMDTWLGDEEAEADKRLQEGSSGTETTETAAVSSGKRPSAERFVRVVGRCTVPGFYSRVASRGLNRSLLTSEDLIKQYLKQEEEDTGAQVAAPQATMNLPEQMAEMAGEWMTQLFGKGGSPGKAGEGQKGAAPDLSGWQQMMANAGMALSMGEKGELVVMPAQEGAGTVLRPPPTAEPVHLGPKEKVEQGGSAGEGGEAGAGQTVVADGPATEGVADGGWPKFPPTPPRPRSPLPPEVEAAAAAAAAVAAGASSKRPP